MLKRFPVNWLGTPWEFKTLCLSIIIIIIIIIIICVIILWCRHILFIMISVWSKFKR